MGYRGNYLAIQPWKKKLCPFKENIKKLVVWIRISNLPIEFLQEKLLKKIGSYIGPTFKLDTKTSHQSRGKFARLCVQIDMDKPLRTSIEVDGDWYKIEYEQLNLICFGCGKYGHNKNQCPLAMNQDVEEQTKQNSKAIIKEALPFGPWMQVSSSNRGRKPKGRQAEPMKTKENVAGPRFSVLEDQEIENDEVRGDSRIDPIRPLMQPTDNSVQRPFLSNKTRKNKEKNKMVAVVEEPTQKPTETSRMLPSTAKQVCNKEHGNLSELVTILVRQGVMHKEANIELEVSRYKEAFARVNWEEDDPNSMRVDASMDMDAEDPPNLEEDFEASFVQETQEVGV